MTNDPKPNGRMLVITSCNACPCRCCKDKHRFCNITGETILLDGVKTFPDTCPLETIVEFYAALKRAQDKAN
ncbi:MAG: hypothetical protein M0R51_12720 [Clostridia bacterium]|jgi:hypothetical protein|nr:hypothetical protein [Clostridia bacterium]